MPCTSPRQEVGTAKRTTRVSTFLERLAQMEAGADACGPDAAAARALLAQRGLTAERIDEAKALIEKLGTITEIVEPPVTVEEQRTAERKMWAWYLEWSGIARVAIRDRRLLRVLGFRQGQRSEDIDETAAGEEDAGAMVSPAATVARAEPSPLQLPSTTVPVR